METRELLQSYDLAYIDEYFDLVIDSYINGQLAQCKNQFFAMESPERTEFLHYCRNMNFEQVFWYLFKFITI